MSLPSVVNRDAGDQREPAEGCKAGDLPWLMASWMYRSRGVSGAPFLFFGPASAAPKTVKTTTPIWKHRNMSVLLGSPGIDQHGAFAGDARLEYLVAGWIAHSDA